MARRACPLTGTGGGYGVVDRRTLAKSFASCPELMVALSARLAVSPASLYHAPCPICLFPRSNQCRGAVSTAVHFGRAGLLSLGGTVTLVSTPRMPGEGEKWFQVRFRG